MNARHIHSKNSGRRRRGPRKDRFAIQQLESRQLMAVDVFLGEQQRLQIRGDDGANVIDIGLVDTPDGSRVQVLADGQVTRWDPASFVRIDVAMGGGDDSLLVSSRAMPVPVNGQPVLTSDGGEGNNRVIFDAGEVRNREPRDDSALLAALSEAQLGLARESALSDEMRLRIAATIPQAQSLQEQVDRDYMGPARDLVRQVVQPDDPRLSQAQDLIAQGRQLWEQHEVTLETLGSDRDRQVSQLDTALRRLDAVEREWAAQPPLDTEVPNDGVCGSEAFAYVSIGSSYVDLGTWAYNGLLMGTPYDDVFYGGFGDDVIHGGLGNDVLVGAGGNDLINGDEGLDYIEGDVGFNAGGNDCLHGGADNDKILGNEGNDLITGGEGDDKLYGEWGADSISGDSGSDLVLGGLGDDYISGGQDPDYLLGGDGADALEGGDGDDLVKGGDGDDSVTGNNGNDSLYGENGNDGLWGYNHHDLLVGGNGDDYLAGGNGDDYIYAGDGHDIAFGDSGVDVLNGQTGNDTLLGGRDGDLLFGQDGNDLLYGQQSLDQIVGGNQDDIIHGNDDADVLYGGRGDDCMQGNHGNDWMWGNDGKDRVFGLGENDSIWGDRGDDFLDGGDHSDTLTGDLDNDILKAGWGGGINYLFAGGSSIGDGDDAYEGTSGTNYIIENVVEAGDVLFPGGGTNTAVPPVTSWLAFPITPFHPNKATGCHATLPVTGHSVAADAELHVLTLDQTNPLTIDFSGLSGIATGEEYVATHAVRFRNLHQIGAQAEGDRNSIEVLDGYEGSYQPDSNTVYASWPNHVEPLTIEFIEPVLSVGSFIATGSQGDIHSVTIRAYALDGQLLNEQIVELHAYQDPSNYEGFWAVTRPSQPIASISIQNNNPQDFGNALILDNLSFERKSPTISGDCNSDGAITTEDIDCLFATGGDVDWFYDEYQTGPGDVNFDHRFDSSDLIAMFQAGKYETSLLAPFAHGDFNGDGHFDSADLIEAFARGGYEQPNAQATRR